MPDYTAWPLTSDVDVKLANLGITPRASATDPYKQQVLDAVTQLVTRITRRTWIAASGTRYFDGSGVGVQELDEFVSLTSVGLLYGTGALLADLTAAVVVEAETGLPNTRIALSRSVLPGWVGGWWTEFPQGRRNIQVVADWGYGATIPADLWDGVAEEAAMRLGDEALFQPGYNAATGAHRGRLAKWKNDLVSQEYDLAKLEDGSRATKRFSKLLTLYTRPLGARLRRWRAPMI